MSISKSDNLLSQLTHLEKSFSSFSVEELSIEEAKALQNSFNKFKVRLENHIYTPNSKHTLPNEKGINSEVKAMKVNQQHEIIAHVSHEMRTPLNGIIGFANLLDDESLDSSQKKKVKAIQLASKSLLNIINELLEYSKVSSDQQVFRTIDFKLEGFIKDVLFLCETLIMGKDVKLSLNLDKDVPKIINGDPSKLSQVLLNIIGNSIKFVEKGKIELDISVLNKTNEKSIIQFKITDTGIGIPANLVDTIFDQYNQGKVETFENYGGTGLGLSITKQIIEKQGGTIKLSSIEGQGTTVTFQIPFALGKIKNIPAKKINTINVEKGKELLSGTSILVFEDNLMNQHLIKEQLSKWGCKVHTNLNLNKGLALMASKAIDLVFMDLKMPVLSGIEIAEKIRNHENKLISEVPIIAFSADFSEQETKDCQKLNIQDFLLKPYTLDDLLLKIFKNKRVKSPCNEKDALLGRKMIEPKETTKLDLEEVLNDCFDDIEMLEELIRLFNANTIEFIGNVKMSLELNDMNAIALSAHKLKAGMAMMKAEGMRELIIEVERNSKSNDQAKVAELYEVFLKDYPVLEENINKELNRIKNRK